VSFSNNKRKKRSEPCRVGMAKVDGGKVHMPILNRGQNNKKFIEKEKKCEGKGHKNGPHFSSNLKAKMSSGREKGAHRMPSSASRPWGVCLAETLVKGGAEEGRSGRSSLQGKDTAKLLGR